MTACPACGGTRLQEIYRLDPVPVQSCVLLDSAAEARDFPRAPLALVFCDDCGFIFNPLFRPELVDYASTTEESQHFSGTFSRFAETLVEDIARHHDLEGRQTLEIGCGKGDFLLALARRTGTRALGIDPGFLPGRLPGAESTNVAFRREYFDPDRITQAPDFVICRHTLEHISTVGDFMRDVARVAADRAAVFFETPDARRVLAEGAFWDIYHEHCSYFTLGSHARLFRAAGLNVTRLWLGYDDQYILQYAEPGAGAALPEEDDLDAVRALAAGFPDRVAGQRAHWAGFVRKRRAAGRRVALWGGGSKAVAFLTTIAPGDEVAQVIDINPFKQGKFLPGIGHRVDPPETLRDTPPDTVVVMNPVYLDEIRATLAALGLHPEVVAV